MRILLFLFLVGFIASCSDEVCTSDDWIGTYIGEKTVNGVTESNYQFTIIQSEDIFTESMSLSLTLDGNVVIVDGCEITGGSVISTAVESYEGSLDGDELEATFRLVGGTIEYFATKQ